MQEIKDTKRIEQVYQTVQHCFRLRPPVLHFLQFEKGELLNHPLCPLDQFLIVAEGRVSIYDLSEDGGIRYVSRTGAGTLLGDVEFCGADGSAFYTEAAERVFCLAIPFAENRETLEDDPVFLRFALRQMAQKLTMSTMDVTMQTLEEKLLLYLSNMQPDHTIHSVNETVIALHCSRRQLQRVLKTLCEEGKLEKTGKGKYRLKQQNGT